MSEATATTTASNGGSIGPRASTATGPLGTLGPLGPVATATMEGFVWDLGQDFHKKLSLFDFGQDFHTKSPSI